ncbi:MAG: beta-galactosidase [Verrucomicrobia bacterium]|nr:beta-galactosidase [Verrucomicrobiota bacterium]
MKPLNKHSNHPAAIPPRHVLATGTCEPVYRRHGKLGSLGTRCFVIRAVAVVLALAWAAVWCAAQSPAANALPLAGDWRFSLDRGDVGIGEGWFAKRLPDRIRLPGTLARQGIGDDVSTNTPWIGGIVDKSWFTAPEFEKYRQPGNVKVPFWLQPEKHYAGVVWYQRDIEIPADWQGKRVVLFLERAHWETRVWVDDRFIGTNNSLATPHEYELGVVGQASSLSPSNRQDSYFTRRLAPGKHTLSIRVDNRMVIDVGENSHCVSDHTQGNWNGLVGKIELLSTPLLRIDDLQIKPDAAGRTFSIEGVIRNAEDVGPLRSIEVSLLFGPRPGPDAADFTPQPRRLSFPVVCGTESTRFRWSIPEGDLTGLELWNEFSPQFYLLVAALPNGSTRTVEFGLRDIATPGTQFTINAQRTFIRGTLDCCIFPKTGHPPMEVGEWRRIIRVAKSYGLNLIRFHSWCPPEAAFQAADELGFYFQIETCWPNQSTTLGDGKPVDQWIYDETDRILKYYGNHPSFLLMAAGNEPGGKNANAYLAKYVEHFKAKDPRRLWTSGAGWPQIAENQFHVTPDPRIQAWGGGLKTRINAKPPETTTDYRDYIAARNVPVISHEIGQWCVYPNFDEIPKYTGYLKPRNFEIFRDRLEANGMGSLAKQFLLASGKLQTLCYKEEIESALRTPGMGGFQLLDLHDFPGQGTALVGVLDPFWGEKGYVTAKEFSRFCNSTVPLARLKKRAFTTDEKLEAEIEVAHFGHQPLENATLVWKLVSEDGKVAASDTLPARNIPVGNSTALGSIRLPLKGLVSPTKYKLVVGIKDSAENDWDVWVYPLKLADEPKDVLVTAQFDGATQASLRSGGKVLLTLPGNQVRNFDAAPVKLGFSSVFWNTAWTGRQAPTTLGILCDPKHPALAQFPTDFHSNWQWWYLIHRAGALRLDLLPKDVEPIVRVIDDWFTARPLGLILEGKVGAGRIVVCGFDLTADAAAEPVSRQMRHSLLAYMDSPQFRPKVEIRVEELRSLIGSSPQGE